MRILVTNDDGIRSRGLHALAVALEERRHDVVVVAPRDDMSGVGAAIGRIRADQRIETSPSVIPEARSLRAHSIDGPPGLAVMAACLGAFGDVPDIVVSGINAGPNTGHACLHSGTVGAALTAATFGVSALAVSSAVADPMQWQTACALLDEAIGLLEQWGRPSVLNLNAPALPPDEVRGLRWARLDRFGRVRLALAASSDRWLQMEYRANDTALDPECDTALLERGYATLTALEAISEAHPEALVADSPHAPPQGVVTEVPASGASSER
jgi:5'-nucleotidase